MKRYISTKQEQQEHANRRARERLHIQFNRHIAYPYILAAQGGGKKGLVVPIEPQTAKPRRWFKMSIQGVEAYALFDRKSKRFVTFLKMTPIELVQ